MKRDTWSVEMYSQIQLRNTPSEQHELHSITFAQALANVGALSLATHLEKHECLILQHYYQHYLIR